MNPSVAHVLQFFEYKHLPDNLHDILAPFYELAHMIASIPANPEVTIALRSLLDCKDSTMRALMANQNRPTEEVMPDGPKLVIP